MGVALVSELSRGFVSVRSPPQENELFVDAHAESLSLTSVFAVSRSGKGNILSLGTGALLNLCNLNDQRNSNRAEPIEICTGQPGTLKKQATAPAGHSHHRKL